MKNFVTGKLKMVVLRCSKIKDIFILLYVCVAAGGGGNVEAGMCGTFRKRSTLKIEHQDTKYADDERIFLERTSESSEEGRAGILSSTLPGKVQACRRLTNVQGRPGVPPQLWKLSVLPPKGASPEHPYGSPGKLKTPYPH